MKQIEHGFASFYYLLPDGRVYNSKTKSFIKHDSDYIYLLKTVENGKKKISLKHLYYLVFHKNYCIDNIQNLDNEEWKDIKGTNGLYCISNKGRVKSLQRYIATILKGYYTKGGYLRVDIVIDNKRITKLIHRLVAAAFLPMPANID